MPFDVDEKYIVQTEEKMNVKFPTSYRSAMQNSNGGEFETEEDEWELYPFLDSSDKKRLSRTCNDIQRETLSSKEWEDFPENAIAIGTNGCGDKLIFLPNDGSNELQDTVYCWSHETGEVDVLATDFSELEIY